jgi:hypothetical protein
MSDSGGRQVETRNDERGPGAWIAALILIAVGIVFLFQNLGYAIPGNWWALFILIPALFSLGSARKSWQNSGRIDGNVAGSLITAFVLIAITLIFLFDLDVNWNMVWPIILILVGLCVLAKAYSRR